MVLKVKLSRIVDYALLDRRIVERAIDEFFKGEEITPQIMSSSKIQSIFNEWLIFEFKLPSGMNIATEYYLRNPDQLPKDQLKELEQIIKTQFYEMLEIERVLPGEWVEAYGLYSGKTYRIFDHLLSLSAAEEGKGCFPGRLAKLEGRWIIVGADTFFLPLTHTPRARKTILKMNKVPLSNKDVWKLAIPSEEKTDKKIENLTPKSLKQIRKKLEKKFNKFVTKFGLKTDFEKVKEFIYQENYKDNFADWLIDLEKIGISKEYLPDNHDLFQDIWNYLPHENLKGKCPAELFQRKYGMSRR